MGNVYKYSLVCACKPLNIILQLGNIALTMKKKYESKNAINLTKDGFPMFIKI